MARSYILRKRENKILYIEFFLLSVLAALLLVINLKLHIAFSIPIAIAALVGMIFLFFQFRLFRYLFSITFSVCWAIGAFLVGQQIEKSGDTTSWVLAVLTLLIALWLHYDHFDFLRKATVYEYEKQ